MTFSWDNDKKEVLRRERGITFERVVVAIESGDALAAMEHPRSNAYPGQRLYVAEIDGYAWVVPYRDEDDTRVLITAYPSRKFTRIYIKES
jgi:uncharacterized DUF497 family protein